ncbi:iron-containing alcohol dehydrogenase [Shouchella sp. 1P09AA]|uniref:iron-containing alcohol dehydrogenase n=1 Tax=unclassified Shouchella TaxID=2893065 RepID=UPI0039A12468
MNELSYYYTPTKVVFGKAAEHQVGTELEKLGVKKVLLHYGGNSAKKSGLLDRVKDSLSENGIQSVELGGVVPNPRLSLVYEGIELVKKEELDFILAVGGGSVIDSAKAIGYGVANEGDVWELYQSKRRATACLPIGTVLTIAAAGSEMSTGSVITKEEGWEKRAYDDDLGRPAVSFLNPELLKTLPWYQTAAGSADILMHTMERYFNQSTNMALTDGLSETILRTVMEQTMIVKEDPQNYEALAELMWASSISHNGLTGFGTDGGDWATHMLEHELSGIFDVTHGAGLAAIWGSWARYVYQNRLDRFVKFAVNVMGVTPEQTDDETAIAGIEKMEAYYRSIDMPVSVSEMDVHLTDEQITEMADKCTEAAGGTIGVVKPLGRDDMIEIYQAAR